VAKKAKAKKGRPSKLATINLDEIERMGGLGLTLEEIGYIVGVAESTVRGWKNNPAFSAALKKGKLRADQNVKQSLYKRALDGDVTAAIFWLKNREPKNWGDKRQLDISSDEGSEVVIKVVKTEAQGDKKDGG